MGLLYPQKIFDKLQRQSFTDVFQNRCSYKFFNMHSKTPVSEFLLNIVAGFRPAGLSKRECFHVNIAKFLRTTLL